MEKVPENFTESKKLSTSSKEKVDKSVDNSNKVLQLPLSKVEPRQKQPRFIFDEGALTELAESIRQHGVLQPILVCEKGDHYEIVAGERRWRAAKLAGLTKIPAILGSFDEKKANELALIENIQREDLNPIEEALAYKQLIDEYGLKQDELARRIAKSRTAVTNSLRLLKLDERVQAMLMDGSLSEGHARTLLALNDKKQQNDLAQEIRDKALSVRETERLIRRLAAKEAEKKEPAPVWRDQTAYDELVMSLRRSLGTKVSIRRTEQEKGQLVIDYYSVEELERIAALLKK